MKKISVLIAALLLGIGSYAAAEDMTTDNHMEATGGHGLHEAQKAPAGKGAPAKAAAGEDMTSDNHMEATGGHALHEATKAKKAKSSGKAAKKPVAEKSEDMTSDNHLEATGGHAVHEATKPAK